MRGWSFTQWAFAVVILCGICAILYIAVPAMGVAIPPFVVNILWVVLVVVVALAAIGVVASMWGGWGGPPSAPGP